MMKNVLDLHPARVVVPRRAPRDRPPPRRIFGSVGFFLYGYQLAFGEPRRGARASRFFGSLWPVRWARDPIGFIFHYSFAATASTIDSGAIAERITHSAYLLMSLTTTTVIYPIVAHWTWDHRGWLYRRGFVDFAGSATVHLVGGVSALVSAAFVGPRIGRFPSYSGPKGAAAFVLHGRRHAADNYYRGLYGRREQEAARGTPYFALRSATNMLYGTFLLFCSWFAFNTGSTYAIAGVDAQVVGGVAISTVLSGAAGAIGVVVGKAIWRGHSRVVVEDLCNGLIAGLVASSCGCAHVTYPGAMAMGLVGGGAYALGEKAVAALQLDDAIGAAAVHGGAGFFSTIFLGFIATDRPFDGTRCGRATLKHVGVFNDSSSPLLGIQIYGTLAIALFSALATRLGLEIVSRVFKVRVDRAAELTGLDLAHHDFCPAPPAEVAERRALLEALRAEVAERGPDFYTTQEPLGEDELDASLSVSTYHTDHYPAQRSLNPRRTGGSDFTGRAKAKYDRLPGPLPSPLTIGTGDGRESELSVLSPATPFSLDSVEPEEDEVAPPSPPPADESRPGSIVRFAPANGAFFR